MSDAKDGGPAYPGLSHTTGYGACKVNRLSGEETLWENHAPGMSLRDRAALAALPVALAQARGTRESVIEAVAASFFVADEFLKARSASPVTEPTSPKVGSDET